MSAGAQTAREDLAFLRVLEGDDELVGRRLKAAREGTAGDGHRLSAGAMGISFGQGARAHHPAAVRSLGLSEKRLVSCAVLGLPFSGEALPRLEKLPL